jgi:hypothetical protein
MFGTGLRLVDGGPDLIGGFFGFGLAGGFSLFVGGFFSLVGVFFGLVGDGRVGRLVDVIGVCARLVSVGLRLIVNGRRRRCVLVETLLDRGADGDVAEAEAATERLAAAPADEGLVMREIWLLRSRALLARAHGDKAGYRDYRDRYRAMAISLGFDGHMIWAEALP